MASLFTSPPEIFNQIIDDLFEKDDHLKSSLASLSLVTKKFYLPAKERMMRTLSCDVLEARKLAVFLQDHTLIGSMIRNIEITCSYSTYKFDIASEEEEAEEIEIVDELELEIFVKVTQFLSHLQYLEIQHCDSLLKQVSDQLQLPIFPELLGLSLGFEQSQPFEGDPVAEFVNSINTPKLQRLDLSLYANQLSNFTTFTKSIFPIRTLRIWYGVDGVEADLTCLPAASLVGLQGLAIFCSVNINSLLELSKSVGTTLQLLHLQSQSILSYSTVLKILPHLRTLKIFSIAKLDDLPVTFLQDLPSTVLELEVPNLEYRHFRHLESHPRRIPLQLTIVSLAQINSDTAIFSILPSTISKVILEYTRTEKFKVQHIFDALQLRKPGKHSLRQILFEPDPEGDPDDEDIGEEDDGLDEEARVEWIRKFKEIGIKWSCYAIIQKGRE